MFQINRLKQIYRPTFISTVSISFQKKRRTCWENLHLEWWLNACDNMFRTPQGSCESDEADKVENLIHIISPTLCCNISGGFQQVCHGSVKEKHVRKTSEHYGGALGGERGNEWKSPTSCWKSAVQHAVLWSLYGGLNMNVNTSQAILWLIQGNVNKQALTDNTAADDGQLHEDHLNLVRAEQHWVDLRCTVVLVFSASTCLNHFLPPKWNILLLFQLAPSTNQSENHF